MRVRWAMDTPADAVIRGGKIILRENGLRRVLKASGGAEPFVIDDEPPTGYEAGNGGHIVGFYLDMDAGEESVLKVTLAGRD